MKVFSTPSLTHWAFNILVYTGVLFSRVVCADHSVDNSVSNNHYIDKHSTLDTDGNFFAHLNVLDRNPHTIDHLAETTEVEGLSYAQVYAAVGAYCEEWAVRFHRIDASNSPQYHDAYNATQYNYDLAENVARQYNLLHLGQVGNLDGVHFFARHVICDANQSVSGCAHTRHRPAERDTAFHSQLLGDSRIAWVSQQQLIHRRRPHTHTPPDESKGTSHIHSQEHHRKQQHTSSIYTSVPNGNDGAQRSARAPVPPVPPADASINRFIDPLWPKQWYLHGPDASPGSNINVLRVWDMNITGEGVVVAVVDDGLERNHPDLLDNYIAEASLDVNGNDDDPMPHYTRSNINKHGTRCAGEIAAVAGNDKCTVGVAYNAKVGGVRMLDGPVTDVSEARSIGHAPQLIDIYANSWGPADDGKSMDAPGPLVTQTMRDGVTKGRQGKGSLYVFASGNGRSLDNCNADGYANSIYTISIGAVSNDLAWPWYAEPCAAQLAVTFSSSSEVYVATTDLRRHCTEKHSGTSAAAPLGAGMIALVLQANNTLTWRDIQYLLVYTSVHINADHESWKANGRGWRYSDRFGFGLMDAYSMVTHAQSWQGLRGNFVNATSPTLTVDLPFGTEIKYKPNTASNTTKAITNGEHGYDSLSDAHEQRSKRHTDHTRRAQVREAVNDTAETDNNAANPEQSINSAANETPLINSTTHEAQTASGVFNESVVWSLYYAPASAVVALESVTVTVNLDIDIRGILEVFLQSPCGTVSQLLTRRSRDDEKTGLVDWTFSSVAFWGENPQGRWLLWVTTHSDMPAHPQAYQNAEGKWVWPMYNVHNGTLKDWSLTTYGTDVGCEAPFCSLPDKPNGVCEAQPWPEALVEYKGTYPEFNVIAVGVLGWAAMVFLLMCLCIAYLRHYNLKSTDIHEGIAMDDLGDTYHRAQQHIEHPGGHAQHADYLQQPNTHQEVRGRLSPTHDRSRPHSRQNSRSPSPMFRGSSPEPSRTHRIDMPLVSSAEAMAMDDETEMCGSIDALNAYSGVHRHVPPQYQDDKDEELDEAGDDDGVGLLSGR